MIILKPALESTNSDLQSQLRKCFTKDFFSVEVLDLCYRLHDSYHHYQDCLFAISVLKYKSYSKFYQMLLLLSGDISLNPGPTPNSVSQSFWKPFENKGLHFLHLNINSILPKLDELKTIAGNTKAAIIGITESKVDNSISDSEVQIPGYCIFRCDRNRNGGGAVFYVRQDLCFNLRITAMGDTEGMLFDILLPKTKPIFVGIIYRPPTCINFLECFNKHLDDINLDNEIFLLGDFNINLFHNGKYILKENQAMQNRIPSTSLVSQYKLFCQRYSLEQIIKHATRTTCSSSTLIDHILTNFREKISQSGVIDIGISDHQLIHLTRKLHRFNSNTHKQIKITSLNKLLNRVSKSRS